MDTVSFLDVRPIFYAIPFPIPKTVIYLIMTPFVIMNHKFCKAMSVHLILIHDGYIFRIRSTIRI